MRQGVTYIEAFIDSLGVVQQISRGYQCFDESLIIYLLVSLDINLPWVALIFLIYLDMKIEEQMSWRNKHLATM